MFNEGYLKPKVFISYSWTSDEYVQHVMDFVYALRAKGVDTVYDKFDLNPGDDKYVFMERIVSDKTINKVLILCDEGYKIKADKREGGVGDETTIITPEIYGKYNQHKFIPVVLVKDDKGNPYLPAYLKSRLYVDITKKSGFTELLRAIYDKPEYLKPPLGKPPAFVTSTGSKHIYRCAICGKPVEENGLLVKLQRPYGTVLCTIPVHKGECDDKLEIFGKKKGINTNSSMEFSFFDTTEDIDAYLNNDFFMTDSEFYIQNFNSDGTLKIN